jgi:hypothetical protein
MREWCEREERNVRNKAQNCGSTLLCPRDSSELISAFVYNSYERDNRRISVFHPRMQSIWTPLQTSHCRYTLVSSSYDRHSKWPTLGNSIGCMSYDRALGMNHSAITSIVRNSYEVMNEIDRGQATLVHHVCNLSDWLLWMGPLGKFVSFLFLGSIWPTLTSCQHLGHF